MKALERLYRRSAPFEELYPRELANAMCEVAASTHRQVGVLADRQGKIQWVILGDHSQLMLPDIGRLRGAQGRFRGLRLLHTHLNHEPLTRDDLVDLTRLRLDLVVAVCMSPEARPQTIYYAHNAPVEEGGDEKPFVEHGPIPFAQVDVDVPALIAALEGEFAKVRRTRAVAKDGRAILIHVTDRKGAAKAEDSLVELRELARTAGVVVVDEILQVRERVDPKFVMGRGKLEDVVIRAMQLDADVLVVDRNLSPAQGSAIAVMTDLKVIDRTQLILDIFAQRAQSADGRLQVELAQMQYLLPRLGTRDDGLSRLTGGIGGRGPGETKLEIGRRRAHERIARLKKQLKKHEKQRVQRRRRRQRRGVPVVAIVGYTNAGKSTLLNALTKSDELAEDKLFATLDTRSRRIRFPRERELVITDTVGFIRDLPRDLFNAFRATFEEAQDADLLLQVVDISDPCHDDHVRTTEQLLSELDLDQVPTLVVYNKVDQAHSKVVQRATERPDTLAVSALDRETLYPLLERMERMLFDEGLETQNGEESQEVDRNGTTDPDLDMLKDAARVVLIAGVDYTKKRPGLLQKITERQAIESLAAEVSNSEDVGADLMMSGTHLVCFELDESEVVVEWLAPDYVRVWGGSDRRLRDPEQFASLLAL